MATPVERRLRPKEVRHFGSGNKAPVFPDLTEIQTRGYAAFLQEELPPDKRKGQGLEAVLREIFPIESYDKQIRLDYLRYELGKPRYTPDECRQLRLTYGRPFRIWLRLNKEQPIDEEVYLGDLPVMLGGGEFIINGAERVVVSQLHRSPGVDFVLEQEGTTDRRLPSCRIIPERGSWIEINVTRKDALSVRIDQSGKFSAMTLLRAMSPKYSSDADLIRAFYETTVESIVDGRSVTKIEGKIAVDDIVYPSGQRAGRGTDFGSRPEDQQGRGRDHLHVGVDRGRSDAARQDAAGFHQPGGGLDFEPRGGPVADLPAFASRQSAPVGKGPHAVSGKVLRRQPLSPGPRGPVPHQSQAQAGRLRRRHDACGRKI